MNYHPYQEEPNSVIDEGARCYPFASWEESSHTICRWLYHFLNLRDIQVHNWLSLGCKSTVLSKLGPYDPRDDDDRTVVKDEFVCVDCGKRKLKNRKSYR